MTLSMTGFGEARASSRGAELRVEVSSVNGRGLTAKLRLPEALASHQPALEARLRERLARGTVTLSISLRSASRSRVRLDLDRLVAHAREFETARKRLPSLPPPDWRTLTSLPGVLEVATEEAPPERLLLRTLDRALDALARDRSREGRALSTVCARLLKTAEETLGRVEAGRGAAVEAYRGRLSERLQAALGRAGEAPLEADLRRELILHVERSDAAEEAARLRVHLAEARRCLAGGEPSGRRLDFLAQEMMREANTLSAKVLDGALSLPALDLKTALDQFKEQVQNIE